jgi:hypothetical protein
MNLVLKGFPGVILMVIKVNPKAKKGKEPILIVVWKIGLCLSIKAIENLTPEMICRLEGFK